MPHTLIRRECSQCGAAVGDAHARECPVDRHARIVEVKYVPDFQFRAAVSTLRMVERALSEARTGYQMGGVPPWLDETLDTVRIALGED